MKSMKWLKCNYLADESGGATELGDGTGDVCRCAAGGFEESLRLSQGDAGGIWDEIDQHLSETHNGCHVVRIDNGLILCWKMVKMMIDEEG